MSKKLGFYFRFFSAAIIAVGILFLITLNKPLNSIQNAYGGALITTILGIPVGALVGFIFGKIEVKFFYGDRKKNKND